MVRKTRGLAVDIDETLSWTIGHWVKELRQRFGDPGKLSDRQVIAKYQYAQNIPQWQTKEALAFMEVMREHDAMHEDLPLIKDSNHTLAKINKIVPIVAYVTARTRNVAGGTKKFLDKHGFPEARMIFRPKRIPHRDGNKWKAGALLKLYPEILGIIDDNPMLIDKLPASYQGTVFLYGSGSYQGKNKNIKVLSCKTWKQVLENVKKAKLLT